MGRQLIVVSVVLIVVAACAAYQEANRQRFVDLNQKVFTAREACSITDYGADDAEQRELKNNCVHAAYAACQAIWKHHGVPWVVTVRGVVRRDKNGLPTHPLDKRMEMAEVGCNMRRFED